MSSTPERSRPKADWEGFTKFYDVKLKRSVAQCDSCLKIVKNTTRINAHRFACVITKTCQVDVVEDGQAEHQDTSSLSSKAPKRRKRKHTETELEDSSTHDDTYDKVWMNSTTDPMADAVIGEQTVGDEILMYLHERITTLEESNRSLHIQLKNQDKRRQQEFKALMSRLSHLEGVINGEETNGPAKDELESLEEEEMDESEVTEVIKDIIPPTTAEKPVKADVKSVLELINSGAEMFPFKTVSEMEAVAEYAKNTPEYLQELTDILMFGSKNPDKSLQDWISPAVFFEFSALGKRQKRPFSSSIFFNLIKDAWATKQIKEPQFTKIMSDVREKLACRFRVKMCREREKAGKEKQKLSR